jgi:hypothetical protein
MDVQIHQKQVKTSEMPQARWNRFKDLAPCKFVRNHPESVSYAALLGIAGAINHCAPEHTNSRLIYMIKHYFPNFALMAGINLVFALAKERMRDKVTGVVKSAASAANAAGLFIGITESLAENYWRGLAGNFFLGLASAVYTLLMYNSRVDNAKE